MPRPKISMQKDEDDPRNDAERRHGSVKVDFAAA
jgi:hypothetical protein